MNNKNKLKQEIETKVFTTTEKEKILDKKRMEFKNEGWIFDFYRILFNPDAAKLIFEEFKKFIDKSHININDYQLAGPESSAIPMLSSITTLFKENENKSVDAIFIRPSRQKDGLLRAIEGNINTNKKIIVIDDIINSGISAEKTVSVLIKAGYTVDYIWTILRFRDKEYYKDLETRYNVKVESVFELNDFFESLGLKNITRPQPKNDNLIINKKPLWIFNADELANLAYVVPKSELASDDENVYYAHDTGAVYAINKNNGEKKWKQKILGIRSKGKGILSNIAQNKNSIFFGAYDGNVYSLDKKTGNIKWVNFDADWIGSSPVLNKKGDVLYVGLEFGVINKKGGIAAINTNTGKLIWKAYHPEFTHSTPLLIEKHNEIIIGSNDGVIRSYNAKTGKLIKEFDSKTYADSKKESLNFVFDKQYTADDIKESIAYEPKKDLIAFGNMNGDMFVLNRKDFSLVFHHKARYGIYASPSFDSDGNVYFSALDKYVYAINPNSKKILWAFTDKTRIFSSPVVYKDYIIVGTNAGRLNLINKKDGELLQTIVFPERITNKVLIDDNKIYVRDYANSVYAFKLNL